jgi:hypothetical protein
MMSAVVDGRRRESFSIKTQQGLGAWARDQGLDICKYQITLANSMAGIDFYSHRSEGTVKKLKSNTHYGCIISIFVPVQRL